ncbi:guanine nucleotide-binding protein subunit gamma 1-like [Impatiens glandulifera]|uniref:guanine nucleotide-binding protein subunit gamma 1-like n=1 Tax=Impatiens glandulifera TaxID=253017 RepID=UPI001FB1691B|nr:guanine nucleotide-binding protein subunit gamma 1-like [Impatiens glandulifera]
MESVTGETNGQPARFPPAGAQEGDELEETRRPSSATPPLNFIGRHRLAAAISNLNQQIQIIQEELDELETLGPSSFVCNELIRTIEHAPDPLLPVTKGPAVVGWDRWFQGAHNSRGGGRKRWI